MNRHRDALFAMRGVRSISRSKGAVSAWCRCGNALNQVRM